MPQPDRTALIADRVAKVAAYYQVVYPRVLSWNEENGRFEGFMTDSFEDRAIRDRLTEKYGLDRIIEATAEGQLIHNLAVAAKSGRPETSTMGKLIDALLVYRERDVMGLCFLGLYVSIPVSKALGYCEKKARNLHPEAFSDGDRKMQQHIDKILLEGSKRLDRAFGREINY